MGARRVVARGPPARRAAAARSAAPVRPAPALAAQARTDPARDRPRAGPAAASGAPWREAAAARARRLPARPGPPGFSPDEAGDERPGPDREARAAQQQFVDAQQLAPGEGPARLRALDAPRRCGGARPAEGRERARAVPPP